MTKRTLSLAYLITTIAGLCVCFTPLPSLAQTDTVITGKGGPPSANEKAAARLEELLKARYRDSHGQATYAQVLSALGSLAGFGCQMTVRELFVKSGLQTEDKAFVIVRTKDGASYFFGENTNHCLYGGAPGQQISVWALVGGGAHAAGAKQLPDIPKLAGTSAAQIGTPAFTTPMVASVLPGYEPPLAFIRATWPAVHRIYLDEGVDPRFQGWVPALAAQSVFKKGLDGFDPTMGAAVVMQSAIPLSKVDPATVGVSR